MQSTVYRAQSTEHRALILLVILVVDKMQIMQHGNFDELWTDKACWFDSWWWNEERKGICNVCWNEIYKQCSLRRHFVLHDESFTKEGKIQMLPVCNKMFITRRNLANPQIMHSESSPHDGDICEEAVWKKDCIKTQYI